MTSPVAKVYDRDGKTVAEPTSTPSAISTTVAADADNSRTVLVVASASGCAPGRVVRVVDPVWGIATSAIATVDAAEVRLVTPLPGVPATGATVRGLEVSVALPAFSALYKGYVLELADAAVEPTVRWTFNVCKYPFVGPCSAQDIRDMVSVSWPGERAVMGDPARQEYLAAEVNARIRARLLKSETYLSDYWDPDAFVELKDVVMRLVLAEKCNLRESGTDRNEYLRGLRFEFRDRIGDIIQSAQLADPDGNGKVSDRELKGRFVIDLAR
jgi:hypothetical protein